MPKLVIRMKIKLAILARSLWWRCRFIGSSLRRLLSAAGNQADLVLACLSLFFPGAIFILNRLNSEINLFNSPGLLVAILAISVFASVTIAGWWSAKIASAEQYSNSAFAGYTGGKSSRCSPSTFC